MSQNHITLRRIPVVLADLSEDSETLSGLVRQQNRLSWRDCIAANSVCSDRADLASSGRAARGGECVLRHQLIVCGRELKARARLTNDDRCSSSSRVGPEHCAPLSAASHLILYQLVSRVNFVSGSTARNGEDLVLGAGDVVLLPRNDLHLVGSDLSLPR